MCEKLAPQKVQATSGLISPDEQYLLDDPSFAGNKVEKQCVYSRNKLICQHIYSTKGLAYLINRCSKSKINK